jgi:ABC-type dipeptide/oligopeptide/nickel transport system ATPase component
VLTAPADAYTRALLHCRPKLDERPHRLPVIADFLGRRRCHRCPRPSFRRRPESRMLARRAA